MHDDAESANGDGSRLQHYWLCAPCAQLYGLAQDESGIHLVKRRARPRTMELELPGPQAIAS
jgi:hypothetical protein